MKELWKTLPPRESLRAPYTPANVSVPADDVYNRSLPRLLLSLTSYGNKVLRDEKISTREDIARVFRICQGGIQPEDFDFLLETERASPSGGSILLTKRQFEQARSLNWTTRVQAVFIHLVSRVKCAVYFVSLRLDTVDVFSIGDVEMVELQQFGDEIISFLKPLVRDLRLSFRHRFQIPSTFHQDPSLLAYILALQLHHRGKYFDLDEKMIILYQIEAVRHFMASHDDWLGKFKFERVTPVSHPYVGELNLEENLQEVRDHGWAIINNIGDGNCGYYSLLSGLENNGNTAYSTTEDQFIEDWQDKVLRLRRDLYNRSVRLLEKNFKTGHLALHWWPLVGVYDDAGRSELNLSFYNNTLTKSDYFDSEELDGNDQMLAMWGPLVFSSLFRMRAILLMRNSSINSEGIVSVNWTTTIFDCRKPLKSNGRVKQLNGIHRISDRDFNSVPTVEILYETGYAGADNPISFHFQFLRRVICDDVQELPPEPNSLKLLSFLKQELGRKRLLEKQSKQKARVDSIVEDDQATNSKDNQSTDEEPVADQGALDDGDEHNHSDTEEELDSMLQDSTDNVEETQRPVEQVELQNEQLDDERSKDGAPVAELDAPLQPQEVELEIAQEETVPIEKNSEHVHESRRSVQETNDAAIDQGMRPVERNSEADEQPQEVELESAQEGTDPIQDSSEQMHESQRSVQETTNPPIDYGMIPVERNNELDEQTNDSIIDERPRTTNKRTGKASKQKPKEQTKRPRVPRGKALQEFNEAYFDSQYWARTLKHKTPARMKYDPVSNTYWICFVHTDGFSRAKPVDDLDEYDDILINQARNRPDVWVGCSIGDPRDEEAPASISTRVRTIYQQHNQRFCLIQCLASALFYCGFKEEAATLDSQKRIFALLTYDDALQRLIDLMPNLVPVIGRATFYNKKKNRNKRQQKAPRRITWDVLFSELVPHPTVIIPVGSDGLPSHAFCVVDDLIFDSTTPFALKLQKESVDWIFDDCELDIYQALRFNMKCSPKGTTIRENYRRGVTLNWDCPSRIFVQRTSSTWYLPHYILESGNQMIHATQLGSA